MTVWKARLPVIVAVAALFMAGSVPVHAQKSELTVGLTSDVPTLDGSLDLSPIGFNVRLNLYDQLTEMRRDGTVGPRLASSWVASPDAKSWTFTVRDNAKFHDGTPVTADDVVWTFRKAIADPRSPIRTYMTKVASLDKVGDWEVRFTLTEPFVIFDRQVSFVAILPQKAYERMGPAEFAQHPIGSGPYELVRRIRDDRMDFRAFDGYWRGAPHVKTVTLRPIPSDMARVSALQTGEIDINPSVAPGMMKLLSAMPDVELSKFEGFRVMFLGFNVAMGPLADPNFRRAVDAAIDRDTICNRLLQGLGKPAGQLAPPITFGYDPSITPTKYDVEAAKRFLAQSSYKGEKIPLQYPNNNFALADEVAQAIAGYLSAIGVNVELRPMEFTAFLPAWANRKLDAMYFFAFGASIFDSDNITVGLYEAGSRIYAVDPKIDQLARAARAETDPAKRKALFADIFRISHDTAAYVPLYTEQIAYATRKRVKWSPFADGFVRFYNVELSAP